MMINNQRFIYSTKGQLGKLHVKANSPKRNKVRQEGSWFTNSSREDEVY